MMYAVDGASTALITPQPPSYANPKRLQASPSKSFLHTSNSHPSLSSSTTSNVVTPSASTASLLPNSLLPSSSSSSTSFSTSVSPPLSLLLSPLPTLQTFSSHTSSSISSLKHSISLNPSSPSPYLSLLSLYHSLGARSHYLTLLHYSIVKFPFVGEFQTLLEQYSQWKRKMGGTYGEGGGGRGGRGRGGGRGGITIEQTAPIAAHIAAVQALATRRSLTSSSSTNSLLSYPPPPPAYIREPLIQMQRTRTYDYIWRHREAVFPKEGEEGERGRRKKKERSRWEEKRKKQVGFVKLVWKEMEKEKEREKDEQGDNSNEEAYGVIRRRRYEEDPTFDSTIVLVIPARHKPPVVAAATYATQSVNGKGEERVEVNEVESKQDRSLMENENEVEKERDESSDEAKSKVEEEEQQQNQSLETEVAPSLQATSLPLPPPPSDPSTPSINETATSTPIATTTTAECIAAVEAPLSIEEKVPNNEDDQKTVSQKAEDETSQKQKEEREKAEEEIERKEEAKEMVVKEEGKEEIKEEPIATTAAKSPISTPIPTSPINHPPKSSSSSISYQDAYPITIPSSSRFLFSFSLSSFRPKLSSTNILTPSSSQSVHSLSLHLYSYISMKELNLFTSKDVVYVEGQYWFGVERSEAKRLKIEGDGEKNKVIWKEMIVEGKKLCQCSEERPILIRCVDEIVASSTGSNAAGGAETNSPKSIVCGEFVSNLRMLKNANIAHPLTSVFDIQSPRRNSRGMNSMVSNSGNSSSSRNSIFNSRRTSTSGTETTSAKLVYEWGRIQLNRLLELEPTDLRLIHSLHSSSPSSSSLTDSSSVNSLLSTFLYLHLQFRCIRLRRSFFSRPNPRLTLFLFHPTQPTSGMKVTKLIGSSGVHLMNGDRWKRAFQEESNANEKEREEWVSLYESEVAYQQEEPLFASFCLPLISFFTIVRQTLSSLVPHAQLSTAIECWPLLIRVFDYTTATGGEGNGNEMGGCYITMGELVKGGEGGKSGDGGNVFELSPVGSGNGSRKSKGKVAVSECKILADQNAVQDWRKTQQQLWLPSSNSEQLSLPQSTPEPAKYFTEYS